MWLFTSQSTAHNKSIGMLHNAQEGQSLTGFGVNVNKNPTREAKLKVK